MKLVFTNENATHKTHHIKTKRSEVFVILLKEKLSPVSSNLFDLLNQRLGHFSHQGLDSTLRFESRVSQLEELQIDPNTFNRIIFGLFSSLLNDQQNLEINVYAKSCHQFFTLSLDCKRSSLLPPKNGIFAPLKQNNQINYWMSVLSSVKESGGRLLYKSFFPYKSKLILQIPLSFIPTSPPMKRCDRKIKKLEEDFTRPFPRAFFLDFFILL